jgi:hypothetical protein
MTRKKEEDELKYSKFYTMALIPWPPGFWAKWSPSHSYYNAYLRLFLRPSSKSNGPNSIWQGALTLSDTITENCPFKERPTIITFMHKSQPCAWIPIEGKTSSLNGARGPILSPQCHSPIHLLYLNPKESRAQCTSRMHKTFATSLSPKVIRKEEFHFSQHLDYSKRELSLRLSRPVTYL